MGYRSEQMTRWEYKVVRIEPYRQIEQLDELGSQGWELAGVRRADTRANKDFFYMKRPIELPGEASQSSGG